MKAERRWVPGPPAVSVADLYRNPEVVAEYADAGILQPAEVTIRDLLGERLASARMLDIGVGGGRTTGHFSPLVADYTGIDISPAMVDACKERFAGAGGAADRSRPRFLLGDARHLPFATHSFDLVLFSFNGIDDLPPGDRARALQEMRRVGRPGGHLCFSSVNIQTLTRHRLGLRRQLCRNPRVLSRNVTKWARLRLIHNRHVNRRVLQTAPHVMMYDHVHGSIVCTHYVRPRAQVNQLARWSTDIRVYSLAGELLGAEDLDETSDHWLYYLARIPSGD